MLGRRGVLLALCAGGLGGCGFHPVYGRFGGREAAALSTIYVPVIPERAGQLLRQALQQRLEASGPGDRKEYELTVSYGVTADAIGYQQDTSSTRLRYLANANWTLKRLTDSTTVSGGLARALDGVNIVDNQYFGTTLQGEVVQNRLAESIAEQITVQLATYFSSHSNAG